ncbi:hypothetical protein ACFYO6_38475 [Streptomyces anthocyanicus]|uniref:Uncharacterized protein n=1 Tax=Streptomyces lividans 1326 TaxID=1200984 RepID=A0A7U9H982_STRLI|nr:MULTISPECIES: hypothetical protein [Streptomyces]EOY45729.1 hypothetical protein SLI_1012 [Streptomyces lividans 1326]
MTAEAFEPVRERAHLLLATAQTQLGHLPSGSVQSRWVWQLGVLQDALERLDTLAERWQATRDELPADAHRGTDAYDIALATHHAECRDALHDWATHGHTLTEINTAARRAPSPLALPPMVTAAPTGDRTAPAHR